MKNRAKNLKNRKEIHFFLEKIKNFKEALNLHNDELSRSILQNYKILEGVTREILKIREDLLENSILNGKNKQTKSQLDSLNTLKRQIEKMKSLIKLLEDLKSDQKMWTNTRVLSSTFPRKIVD